MSLEPPTTSGLRLEPYVTQSISQMVSESQLPRKVVNLLFQLVTVNDKSTILWGVHLLNHLVNQLCEIKTQTAAHSRPPATSRVVPGRAFTSQCMVNKSIVLRKIVKWFRGGLVFKANRLLHHSALGWKVNKEEEEFRVNDHPSACHHGQWLQYSTVT